MTKIEMIKTLIIVTGIYGTGFLHGTIRATLAANKIIKSRDELIERLRKRRPTRREKRLHD